MIEAGGCLGWFEDPAADHRTAIKGQTKGESDARIDGTRALRSQSCKQGQGGRAAQALAHREGPREPRGVAFAEIDPDGK